MRAIVLTHPAAHVAVSSLSQLYNNSPVVIGLCVAAIFYCLILPAFRKRSS